MADKPNIIDRFLAAVLMAGGLLGAGMFLYFAGRFLYHLGRAPQPAQWVYLVPLTFLLSLFVWSVIVGLRFWRGESSGSKWATVLFAMQIPILTVPGMRYEYYTGIAIELMGGYAAKRFTLEFGSQASMWLGTGISGLIYGVNLFALAAVGYLLVRRMKYGSAEGQMIAAEDK